MMVVTSGVLLALRVMRPFQELLQLGLVKRLAPEAIATFISHQCLARDHPDPHGVQLRSLQLFLRTAGLGQIKDLFSEQDWNAFKSAMKIEEVSSSIRSHVLIKEFMNEFSRHGPKVPDEVLSEELAHSFLWIDFLSVPQDVRADDDSQLRAIQSIPYYIAQRSFFIVLCPNAEHSGADELSAYESWLQLGWCRFESWSHVLRH